MTVVLLAVFTAINFLGMQLFSKVNSGITWWKVAVPVLAIIVLLFKFHGNNIGAGGGFMPFGVKALFGAHPVGGHRLRLPGLRAGGPARGRDQEPAAQPAAGHHQCLHHRYRYLLHAAARVHRRGPAQPDHRAQGLGGRTRDSNPVAIGPFACLAGLIGLGWLAVILRIDAFVSPFGTGLIYQTSTSRVGYGLARNRYYPQMFAKVDRNGVPWFSLLFAFLFGLLFLLPFPSWHSLVGLVTSASVLMYAGAPLSLGAFRGQVPERPSVPDAGGPWPSRRLRSSWPTCSSTGQASR